MGNIIKSKKGILLCENCKEPLDIKYSQTGEVIYDISLDSQNNIQFELDEVVSDDAGIIFCANCGEELFEYDEKIVEKLLKSLEK